MFILVVVLCEFAKVPEVCTFYCSLRKKRCTLLYKGTDVHIQQHIHQKYLNLCLLLHYYGKVIVELEKTQTRNSTVFIVLIIWPISTLKFLFVFGFNEYLWAVFSLLSFKNFWFCICVVVVLLLILRHIWLYVTSYTHAHE